MLDMRDSKSVAKSIAEGVRWKAVLKRNAERANTIIHNVATVYGANHRGDSFAARRARSLMLSGVYTPLDFGGTF